MLQRIIQFWLIAWVLISSFTLVAIIIHNVWAIWTQEPTVTSYIRDLAHREPMLVWLFGLVVGIVVSHLFWYKA